METLTRLHTFLHKYTYITTEHGNIKIIPLSKKKSNSLHLRSEEISLVEEWISLDSNSSRVKIHYSASEISSGSKEVITELTTQGVKLEWTEFEWFFFRELHTKSTQAHNMYMIMHVRFIKIDFSQDKTWCILFTLYYILLMKIYIYSNVKYKQQNVALTKDNELNIIPRSVVENNSQTWGHDEMSSQR